jgi:hypothetical protein
MKHQNLPLGIIQVSDACSQCIWFFILSSSPIVVVHNSKSKLFEVPKLAFGNIQNFDSWMQLI